MTHHLTDLFTIRAQYGEAAVTVGCEAILIDRTWTLRMSGGVPLSETQASDLFEALAILRLRLEPEGYRFLINGCRENAWPSGMQRDQGSGTAVYLFPEIRPGAQATESVLTFSEAPADLLVTFEAPRRAIDMIFSGFRPAARRGSEVTTDGSRTPLSSGFPHPSSSDRPAAAARRTWT